MFVTYKLPETTLPFNRFHEGRHFTAASQGEYPTRFKAAGNEKHLAALVNIKDHRFLEAVRELVRKINEHDPHAEITLHEFLLAALKKTLGDHAHVSKKPIEYYKERLDLNGRARLGLESFKAIGLGNTSIVVKRSIKTLGITESAQAALISTDDHDFLQALRAAFKSSSQHVQKDFAKNVLREFMKATGITEIEGDLFEPITGINVTLLNPRLLMRENVVNICVYAPS